MLLLFGVQRLPPQSTYGSVVGPLADLGSSLLVKTLEDLRDGKVRYTSQPSHPLLPFFALTSGYAVLAFLGTDASVLGRGH